MKKKVRFSEQAEAELSVLDAAIREILGVAVESFINDDINEAYRVEPLEERIDVLCDEMKLRHIDRLQRANARLRTASFSTTC